MSAAHDATIRQILDMNPGITFGRPDAFYGNRPMYFTDGTGEQARVAARAWLKDPEGYSGARSDFAGWNLTAAASDPSVFGEPWLLPASTGLGNSPQDIVGSWGYGDGSGGTVWWDVLRAGYLVPNVQNKTAPLPPAWAIASSPYSAALFHVGEYIARPSDVYVLTDPPAAQSTSAPPANNSPVKTTAAGTPITGNANDRFLVGGVTYDGLGHVMQTASAAAGNGGSSSSRALAWFGVGTVVWNLARHSRTRR